MLQVVMKQNAVIEHLKQKKTLTPAEREENQRSVLKPASVSSLSSSSYWPRPR